MASDTPNRRIAKNTLYNYIRLIVTMGISLYISRIVMEILGVSNYGLFGVVGGVLGMFTFLNGALSEATSRFFNVEMGRPGGDVNRMFNINLVLHTALAAIIFVVAEIVGMWYIKNRLVVEPGRMDDAIFIFQLSILTCCLGIMNGPYGAIFGAHEKFKFCYNLEIINHFIRATLVILLQFYGGDALRPYAIITVLTTANTFVIYHWVAARRWPQIVKIRFIRGWRNYTSVLKFSVWQLLTTLSLMFRGSGSDLLINAFFGTSINGVYALSKTVTNYVRSYSTTFNGPTAPQVIQAYSKGDMSRCSYLLNKVGRVCMLLFIMLLFPLWIEMGFVLSLWLKSVPADLEVFCKWNLIMGGVALSSGALVNLVNAYGRIGWFKVNMAFWFVFCIPLAYVMFRLGAPGYYVIIAFMIADVMLRTVQLILMHRLIGFDSWLYVKEAYGRPALIALIMSGVMIAYPYLGIEHPIARVGGIVACAALTASLIYSIGLTGGERRKVISIIKSKLIVFCPAIAR